MNSAKHRLLSQLKPFFLVIFLYSLNIGNTYGYQLNILGGVFYGPGNMPNSRLPQGSLGNISLDKSLNGRTQYFNNGPDEPNISSEVKMQGSADGLLSNGTPFNEFVDGGIAEVGLGAMRFLTVIAGNGPNKGTESYSLTQSYDWLLVTDLALDPGFAKGVVISNDLHITTGVVYAPYSLQSNLGEQGGMNTAGSLPSGAPIIGRLGDYNYDGYLDGKIIGASNLPMDHMLLPGAPVVQERDFSSDIEIEPINSLLLTLASINNFMKVWEVIVKPSEYEKEVAVYIRANLPIYLEDIKSRLNTSIELFGKVPKALGFDQNFLDQLFDERQKFKQLSEWSKGLLAEENVPPDVDLAMNALFENISRMALQVEAKSTLK